MNRAFIQITIHSAGIKYNVFNCVLVRTEYAVRRSTHAQKVRKGAQLRRVRKGCVNLRIYAFFAIFVLVWIE